MRRAPTMLAAGAVLGAAIGALRAGQHVEPAPFRDFPQPSGRSADSRPLPEHLPGPVDRWLRGIYGDAVPVVRTLVVTGRGRINPFGVWMQMRFRFTHEVGRGYRHYIEATWGGRPVLRVNERYLDGRSLIEIPIVGTDSGPKVEQAANLGMWAELAAAAPSALVTDPRVRWRPLDDESAALDVPLGDTERDSLVARFDAATGALRWLEAWRYRSTSEPDKILWIAASEPGPTVGPLRLPAVGTATWADQGQPWARFVTEDIRTDVDVATYLRARGI
jgi:Family of unknown function (DUF6544)